MRFKTLILVVFVVLFACCKNTNPNAAIPEIDADSIVLNINKYNKTTVKTQGVIVHVCGVDAKKMKLITSNGAIIKIVFPDSIASFDKSFVGKTVYVTGLVSEFRLIKQCIDSLDAHKSVLCHIDNNPCKDTAWIAKHKRTGKADTISKNSITNLNNKMQLTGRNYISVVSIVADKLEIAEVDKI